MTTTKDDYMLTLEDYDKELARLLAMQKKKGKKYARCFICGFVYDVNKGCEIC